MSVNDYTLRILPQRLGTDLPLGRHVEHDHRSRTYAYAPQEATLKSVQHIRRVPVFDQARVGSCTGEAMAGVLGTDPFYGARRAGTVVDQGLALQLYATATTLDSLAGSYPPDDTGSTGLAVAKAARAAGLIAGYLHTFSFTACLAALVQTPVCIGTNWYASMDTPDANGLVSIPAGATPIGGHEYLLDGLDLERRLVWATNSWSANWGKQGRFAMSFDTMERLLAEQGDVVVPIAPGDPAPVPVPAPGPVPPVAPNPNPSPTPGAGPVVNPLPATPTPTPTPAPAPPNTTDQRALQAIAAILAQWHTDSGH